MGILNRIVNILILLAAIAAVVFSYMLFSKRANLTDGWQKMADSIQQTAKTLDDNGASGTKAAQELAADKLAHTQYESLDQVLPKLKDNAAKIVKQRNDLAEAIQKAAGTLEITGVEKKDFQNVNEYTKKNEDFASKVSSFRNNRDAVFNSYVSTGRQVGASVSVNDLKNPASASSAISKVNSGISDMRSRRDRYASQIGNIAGIFGVKRPNLNGTNYNSELNSTVSSLRSYKNEAETAKRDLRTEKNRTASLNNQIKTHLSTIQKHKNTIQEKQGEIDKLNRILSDDGKAPVPAKLLNSADVECYRHVKGKIEYIDKEFGFLTINIGSRYSFVQKYGIKDNVVAFPLTVGKTMTVARGLSTETPQFVGKLLVTKVDDYSAICNLVSGNLNSVSVGDEVYFADEDIAAATGKTSAAKADK